MFVDHFYWYESILTLQCPDHVLHFGGVMEGEEILIES
jgi:hypothetical protein